MALRIALQRQQKRRARLQEGHRDTHGQPLPASQFNQPWLGARRGNKVITQAELDELVEAHEDSGRCFRRVFFGISIAIILLLLLFKYDIEYNVEVPDIGKKNRGSGKTGSEEKGSDDTNGANRVMTTSVSDLNKYFDTLGVSLHYSSVESAEREEEAKKGRLENFRVKKQVREAYQRHLKDQSVVVHCGRSCQEKQNSVEYAYNKLAAHVDRELFGVLLGEEDTKSARSASPALLQKKYEEKKKAIESTETDEELREMALEELRDAYDILRNPDARKYYLLYGEKPPESIFQISARHGGWGQEIGLGTYKYRLIWMWLDYFHNSFGLLGETIVLGILVLVLLLKIPKACTEALQIATELEESMSKKE